MRWETGSTQDPLNAARQGEGTPEEVEAGAARGAGSYTGRFLREGVEEERARVERG